MEKKLINQLRYFLIFFTVIVFLFIGFFTFKNPTITGNIIYEEILSKKNWTFDTAADYVYDSNLISLADENAALIPTITLNYWDSSTEIKYTVEQAIYDGEDSTGKVTALADGNMVKVNKVNIFDVTFSDQIDNGDKINLYLTSDPSTGPTDIYLCDTGTPCSYPGYGAVHFDDADGWYNLTVSGLSVPMTTFNIDPDKVNFDFIEAIHIETTENNSSNITYPTFAAIETKDFSITGLSSYSTFYKNELLDNQNIDYYYSTDSGNSWSIIPSDNDISGISISSSKIRIKVELSTDRVSTPLIHDFAVSYITQTCNENWNLTHGACLIIDTKLKYYIDKNECATTNDLPTDNGTLLSCDYCTPSWTCLKYGSCLITNKNVCSSVFDGNSCFNVTGLDSDKYSGDYDEFNQSCVYGNIGTDYQNLSISLIANEKTIINAINSTDSILEISINKNADDKLISLTRHNTNLKNTSPEAVALGKYLDIIADDDISSDITYVKIRIYYTDEELNNANLDEETLEIHYFNETSNEWQILNSTVNTTGNYVEVTIDHLSTFGIFGEEKESSESSSGGGSRRTVTNIIIKPKQEEEKTGTLPEKEEVIVEKEVVNQEEVNTIIEEKIEVEEDLSGPASTENKISPKIVIFPVSFIISIISIILIGAFYIIYRKIRKTKSF